MRDTVNEDDKRAGSAPSANADTLHHEADNKETTIPTKDWQADLAKSIISMFNQYLDHNPQPESKNTPATGTTEALKGTIKTQPSPAKTDPFTQWLLERTPPRQLAGGKLERTRTTQAERMLHEGLKNRATASESRPTRPPNVTEVNYAAALLTAKEQDRAVLDGGCTIFMSPLRRHFIQHTLKPTLQRIMGVDGVPIRADAEGYAQVAFPDHHTKKICRATMQGLLTEKAHPTGLTLLSYPQWQREEGVGLKNPTNPNQPAILHTGENESSVEFLVDYDQGGLLTVPLLDGNQVAALQQKGYILEDITSPPLAVLNGQGRSREVFKIQRTMIATTHEGETPSVTVIESPGQTQLGGIGRADGRALRKLAAKIDSTATDADEAQNLRRLLPRRMLQATKIHATMGYPAPKLFNNIIENTTGHGLKVGDHKYLRHTLVRGHAYHGAPPGRKKIRLRKHKTPSVVTSQASSTPRLRHAPKLADPRRVYKPFESFAIDTLVHQSRGIQDYKYALTCVELHTKYTYTYLMKRKNEAYFAMRRLRAAIKTEHGADLKHIYSDGAKEFATCNRVGKWARRNGIKQSVSSPYIHWMQGAVENMNKEYKKITRALLKGAGHPKYMWPLAHAYAQTIINYRYRTKGHRASPHERAFGTKPDLTRLHVYGTPAEVRVHKPKSLQSQSTLAIYIGPAANNPLINVSAPMSHLVLTGEGKYAEIQQNASITFDHLFDLDEEIREKFFTGSEQDTESQHSTESSFHPIPSTVGSGTTDRYERSSGNSTNKSSSSKSEYDCRYQHDGDGRSMHGSAMRRSNADGIASERRLRKPTVPSSTAHSSQAPESVENAEQPPPAKAKPAGRGRKPTNQTRAAPGPGGAAKKAPPKVPMHLINKIISENPPIVVQQENPKKLKTKSGQYYEVYKAATTPREYLRIHPEKGNTSRGKADLQHDITQGFINLEASTHHQEVLEHMNLHKALQTEAFGLTVQPLCIPGNRPIKGKLSGTLVEFTNDRFTVTADVAELRETAPELQQSMLDAMVSEMESLLSMNTFRWATKPANAKCISTRMVLKTKYRADGKFDKHKARLVVRGFLQKQGKDYFDTFTPTSDFMTFRVLMAEAQGGHHQPTRETATLTSARYETSMAVSSVVTM